MSIDLDNTIGSLELCSNCEEKPITFDTFCSNVCYDEDKDNNADSGRD